MTHILKWDFAGRKRRILARLDETKFEGAGPVLADPIMHYEVAQCMAEIACPGLGMILDMVPRLGLADTLKRPSALFKRCLPHSESDRVLNMAYNLLAGGACLEYLKLRRKREAYLIRFWGPTSSRSHHRR